MQKLFQNQVYRKKAAQILLVIAGNCIMAAGIGGFILPAGLMMGGATGIGLAASHYFGLPVSTFVGAYNILMFFIGAWLLGRHFALTTLISSFLFPALLGQVERLVTQPLTDDIFLNILAGGALAGAGIGLVIRAGASTGGNDIPMLLLKRKLGIPLSVSMYSFDIVILLLQLPFSDLENALYSIVLVVLYSMMADKASTLGKSQLQVRIISSEYQRICRAIQTDVDRGATLYHIIGGYSSTESFEVMTVISPRELNHLNQLITEIDPKAFMTLARINEVHGRGFTMGKKEP